jgi:glutamate N-acetyltransferase/amino-acid N-acetyltransferase
MAAIDPSGHVTSPRGFRAGATYAGVKTYGEGKLDLAVLVSDFPCATAAVYTRSRLHAPSIDINRAKLAVRSARGVVVNAGVANASTGDRGVRDGYELARLAAVHAGLPEDEMLVCSTGVIGRYLPMDRLASAMPAIDLSPGGGPRFARAIMTTDTRPKMGAVQFGPYTIGGVCKGSGMIHPNMATMLAFLATDAPIEPGLLRGAFSRAVDESFNLVSVDGDTSPSDTAIIFANGAAGGETISEGSPLAQEFEQALRALCIHLAREIARDGEGATRLIEFTVTGAATIDDARQLVRLLSTSYLLKSAIHGADPNWGRIAAVVGRSGVAFDEDRVTIDLCGTRVFERTRPAPFDPEALSLAMRGPEVSVGVHLGAGNAAATGWGCDLSAEYVSINADYHT